MDYIVETNALTKKYGSRAVVNGISIHVKKGDIYGLIGKNGAGKTSLMKLLLGLTLPDSGSISFFGGLNLNDARAKTGSLIEAPALYKNETAYENLKRLSLLSGSCEEEISRLLELTGLSDTGQKKVKAFSLGMRQRLGIALALSGHPQLLILDEPVNGLDPAGIKEIRDLILELNRQGVTFIIASHLLDELGKVATHYGIIANGILVEELTAASLAERCRTTVNITVQDAPKAASLLTSLHKDMKLEYADNVLRILSSVQDTSVIVEELVQNGVRVYELKREGKGLEDFFIERLEG